jgi:hypothetical protein
MDEYNEKMIMKHIEKLQSGYLGAVHLKKPSDSLVAMGGYKTLLPLFSKSISSNLDRL